MKNLSLINSVWIQRLNPNITSKEHSLLMDNTIPLSEEKKTLMENIKSRSQQPASTEDASVAQAIYDSHKLADATLISVDVYLPSGGGVINCRVNNKHKQIRF